jgi:hypothetical protein
MTWRLLHKTQPIRHNARILEPSCGTGVFFQTAIDLIGTTRTTTGLTVICVRDDTEYELAKKVSDEDFATINLVKIVPFESWNYRILPQ